jgi:hypothetical protein
MAELRAAIYQSVATPKQFLWAPFELAMINIVMSIMIMILCIAVFMITPFFAIIPLVVGHIILVGSGTRNPHLVTTLQSSFTYPAKRKNLTALSKGVKYVP